MPRGAMDSPRLLALDPGVRGCGVAVFQGNLLLRATYVPSPALKGMSAAEVATMAQEAVKWAFPFDEVVVEVPRVYPAARQKGDQNDLIAVAGVAFGVAARATAMVPPSCVHSYSPREWKGTLDADDMIERIKARLSPAEIARIITVRNSLMHNVFDAIGIGLKKLGRLEPRRIISRGP